MQCAEAQGQVLGHMIEWIHVQYLSQRSAFARFNLTQRSTVATCACTATIYV